MQINDNISVTRDRVLCRSHGQTRAQDLLNGNRRLCQHASAGEVGRIVGLLQDLHRRRRRPTWQNIDEVQSQHQNGTYRIALLNADGTFACSCLSFLGNRDLEPIDVRESISAASCKHIRDRIRGLRQSSRAATEAYADPTRPSAWQKLVLRAFAIEPHTELTNAQAYFVIRGLLAKHGVDYAEFEDRMRREETITLLPINAFGVEFEGCGVPNATLARILTDQGIPTHDEGYNHTTRDYFKVVSDASVQGTNPFELVTPKLFGADGFDRLRKLCRVARTAGASCNRSAGLHVHVDAWNLTMRDAKRVAELWYRFQTVILHLVPASRRSGSYCQPMTPELLERIRSMRRVTQLGGLPRYHGINLSAYAQHNTIEYRLHSSTFNSEKAISWVVFLLLLTASARRGLDPTQVPATWSGLAGAIGLTTGTSVIRSAYRYLTRRYEMFTSQSDATEAA